MASRSDSAQAPARPAIYAAAAALTPVGVLLSCVVFVARLNLWQFTRMEPQVLTLCVAVGCLFLARGFPGRWLRMAILYVPIMLAMLWITSRALTDLLR